MVFVYGDEQIVQNAGEPAKDLEVYISSILWNIGGERNLLP